MFPGAVKVGPAVLGVTGLDRDGEPESELWALAVALDGWGRRVVARPSSHAAATSSDGTLNVLKGMAEGNEHAREFASEVVRQAT